MDCLRFALHDSGFILLNFLSVSTCTRWEAVQKVVILAGGFASLFGLLEAIITVLSRIVMLQRPGEFMAIILYSVLLQWEVYPTCGTAYTQGASSPSGSVSLAVL